MFRAIELIGATVVATSSLSGPPVKVSCQPSDCPAPVVPLPPSYPDGAEQPTTTVAHIASAASVDRDHLNQGTWAGSSGVSPNLIAIGCNKHDGQQAFAGGPSGGSAGRRRRTIRTWMKTIPELEPAAIRAAHGAVPAEFRDSPQYVHDGLSARLGVPVIVKLETANPIRSFKGRGTWIVVQALARESAIDAERPIVCASAGNFGQGVAYAARAVGVTALVFASRHANPGKVARMRALGAEVVQVGEDFDEARAAADAHVTANGGYLLVDGDDARISTGAAGIAVELTDAADLGALPSPAVVSVPVGNGALINGMGSWLRAVAPGCRVLGIQAEGAAAMMLSWRAGRPIDTPTVATFADGIAARVAIPAAVELMAGRIDEMRLVSDDDLLAAQAELTTELGVTVEGAAAASWAGLLAGPRPDGPAVLIITGSNV